MIKLFGARGGGRGAGGRGGQGGAAAGGPRQGQMGGPLAAGPGVSVFVRPAGTKRPMQQANRARR